MLSKYLNIHYRCSTYCGRGLKEEYAGKYLSGWPRPPSQNVDFAQFLVGSGILSGWRCPQPESRDPLTPLKDTNGTNDVGWQWYYHRVYALPNPIVETRSPLRKAHWNRFWSWPLCFQGFYNTFWRWRCLLVKFSYPIPLTATALMLELHLVGNSMVSVS